jgi:hypothetical protein
MMPAAAKGTVDRFLPILRNQACFLSIPGSFEILPLTSIRFGFKIIAVITAIIIEK